MANSFTNGEVWQTCLDRIQQQISQEEFARWFAPIKALGFNGTKLRLEVPSESYVSQIENKYRDIFGQTIFQMYGKQTCIIYAIPDESRVEVNANTTAISNYMAQNDTSSIKNPFTIPGLRRMRFDPQLNNKYTFSTHIEGECNRLARSAGRTVALTPGSSPFNPLYIYGGSGLGKTHIAQAIGHEVRERHPELQVLYVSTNKFMAQYQTAVKNKETNDFVHFYQMVDVLIIDDIQELSGRSGTQNVFFNIFSHLQMAGKQLILTSDKPPVELADIEQRLLTRFKWGLSAKIDTPDYETKIKIIRTKAHSMEIPITEEVVTYLADNISANIREIEGALLSLKANASFMGRRISTSLAKDVLKAYIQVSQKEISVARIIEAVCRYYDIDEQSLNSSKRTRDLAQARQVAMYLAKQHTKLPLAAIGSAIGGRNHATVLHSFKQVTNMLDTDKLFRGQIEELEKMIIG
ncbi:MAG: chromosomal replication initiator protein DnaA [Alistipes sp.]|nr:chromosomal replication initiator protein DnaA [Alistipes sp.]